MHPSAVSRHSCCVLVPPSGISHLPPAPPPSFPPDLSLSVTAYICFTFTSTTCGRETCWAHLSYRTHRDGNRNKTSQHDSTPHSELYILHDATRTGRKNMHSRQFCPGRKPSSYPASRCHFFPGFPYQTRSSLTSRASGLAPGHRIKDRDYLGWMDFGRRSAEEYEYSS